MIRVSGRARGWAGALALMLAWGCATTRYEAPEEAVSPRPPVAAAVDSSAVSSKSALAQIDSLKALVADQARQIADVGEANADLSGKVAVLNDRIKGLEDQVQALSAPARPPARASGGRKAVPQPQSRSKALYQNALRDFEARRFAEAIKGLSEILNAVPKDGLADNAQYWIGECYYGLKNYGQAIKEFQKVFAYPKTTKDDDAQLKIGICYSKMGDAEKATIELKRLTVDYPESEYAGRAEALLRDLQAHREQATK